MSESPAAGRLAELLADPALAEAGVDGAAIDGLASQLLWRIGRVSDDAPVTVRVGFASSAPLFEELPRLRGTSDGDLEEAVRDGTLRVEWVGYRPE